MTFSPAEIQERMTSLGIFSTSAVSWNGSQLQHTDANPVRMSDPPHRGSNRRPPQDPEVNSAVLPQEAEYIIVGTTSEVAKDKECYEFVEEPPQDYTCQVCFNILQEPHVTDCCGQHFCKSCLEACVNEYTRLRSCPHCRETKFKHLIYKPFQRKINALMVYCQNHSKGCSETMKLAELDKHLSISNDSGCSYTMLLCPNDCGDRVCRKDIETHCKRFCKQRKVTCKYCRKDTVHYLLEEHLAVCDHYPVTCSRNCTQDTMLRCDLDSHEKFCPKKLVKCPFHDAGCEEVVIREKLAAHLEANTGEHLGKMMTAYCELKKEFNGLKSECKTLQNIISVRSEVH